MPSNVNALGNVTVKATDTVAVAALVGLVAVDRELGGLAVERVVPLRLEHPLLVDHPLVAHAVGHGLLGGDVAGAQKPEAIDQLDLLEWGTADQSTVVELRGGQGATGLNPFGLSVTGSGTGSPWW